VNAAEDLAARWLPEQSAIDLAVRRLEASPSADYAAVPMYQPGKEFGWWEAGQEVCTVPDVAFIGVNRFEAEGDVPSFAWARNAAAEVAREHLGGRPGTVAWASVNREGHAAVFEDFS
jgi:hypothetical protein